MLFKSHLWDIHMYRPYTKPVQIITNCLEIQKNMFSITFKCLETISSKNSNFEDSNKNATLGVLSHK